MKKIFFSLIATVVLGAFSVTAQSRIPKGFTPLKNVEIGLVSSYAGSCVSGGGICSGSTSPESSALGVAVIKVSNTAVKFAFSKDFYAKNQELLQNGLVISKPYSLSREVSAKIGLEGEFVIASGKYKLENLDGIYYMTLKSNK